MFGALGIIVAASFDVLFGDPPRWPHLVRWLGKLIEIGERLARRWCQAQASLLAAGGVIALVAAGGSGLVAWAAMALLGALWAPLGWLLGLLLSFQCLAAGQLWREVDLVARALNSGRLALARQRLAMIVGRDTSALDPEGVRRALVETLAENLNDGVVAPLFYLAIGGPAAAVAYKAVNTMDSMLGYRNERYQHLGKIPARLDDVAGWIPARLTALAIIAASPLLGLSPAGAWRSLLAHHGDHLSPNSGWPEAAAAGALDIRLGGPNLYHGLMVSKPWINPGGRAAMDGDVAAGLRLLVIASLLCTLLAALVAWPLRSMF